MNSVVEKDLTEDQNIQKNLLIVDLSICSFHCQQTIHVWAQILCQTDDYLQCRNQHQYIVLHMVIKLN